MIRLRCRLIEVEDETGIESIRTAGRGLLGAPVSAGALKRYWCLSFSNSRVGVFVAAVPDRRS